MASTTDIERLAEINDRTGYANDDQFADEAAVLVYFSPSEQRAMFGDDAIVDIETLASWAALVIRTRSHMSPEMTSAETISETIEQAAANAPCDESWQAVHQQHVIDGERVWVEFSTRITDECAGCGQPIGPAGSFRWMDRQGGSGPGGWWEIMGAHNQQHGCGAWNAPEYVERWIALGAGEDEYDLDTVLRQMLAELMAAVREAS